MAIVISYQLKYTYNYILANYNKLGLDTVITSYYLIIKVGSSIEIKGATYMQFAYYINNNGEKRIINAKDAECRKYLNRLICPYCGEKLDWIDGKKITKYFRHHHGSYRDDCEKYCKSITESTSVLASDVEFSSLYLVNEFDSYSLSLGLFGLDENTILEAEKMNLEIKIVTGRNSEMYTRVNQQNFVPHKTEFIKLSEVKEEYKLEFSDKNIPNEVRNRWGEGVSGVGRNGAVFEFREQAGKKVSSTKGIFINEEYLLFTVKHMSCNHGEGIVLKELQNDQYGLYQRYKIYKLVITSINYNTVSFCDQFDLELHAAKPKIISIWPPCIERDEKLLYVDRGDKYFVLESDTVEDRLYSEVLQKRLKSEVLNNRSSLTVVPVNSEDRLIVDKSDSKLSILIDINETIAPIRVSPINITTDSNKSYITNNTKVFLNSFRHNVLLKSCVLKKRLTIDVELNEVDCIEILHGTDVVWKKSRLPSKERNATIDEIDKKLFRAIKSCRGKQVKPPDSFKWMVVKQKKYHRSYSELMILMKKQSISIELIKLLKRLS